MMISRAGYGQRSKSSRYFLIIGVGSRDTDFRWFDNDKDLWRCIKDENIEVFEIYRVKPFASKP